MSTFDPKFLAELKMALTDKRLLHLSEDVENLRVYEYVEGNQPPSQFIYVQPKSSLPQGEFSRVLVGGVPGLLCLLVDGGRIAAIEMMGRDVLWRTAV
jgi:hypothetical protein